MYIYAYGDNRENLPYCAKNISFQACSKNRRHSNIHNRNSNDIANAVGIRAKRQKGIKRTHRLNNRKNGSKISFAPLRFKTLEGVWQQAL